MVGLNKRNGLYKLLEYSADPMCTTSEQGYIVQVNPAFCRILGLAKEKVLGQHFTRLLHPDDLESVRIILKKHFRGEKVSRFEARFKTNNGQDKWLSWQLLSEPFDKILIAIARDITACLALKESEKHLDQLINEVFRYQKIGTKEVLRCQYVDLNDVISKVELSLQAQIIERNVSFFSHDLPVIYSNEQVLFIVLKNLIEKSLAHTKNKSPYLEVRYHQSRQTHYLSIKNNATRSISAVDSPTFISLKRLHADQSFQSNDMALVLSQKLIEKIDGQILFSPASTETGSIFQLCFPITKKVEIQEPPLVINLH